MKAVDRRGAERRPTHQGLRRCLTAAVALAAVSGNPVAAARLPDTILYGAAYYDEYAPASRAEEDARLMKAAGINVVRIAESTWGTLERQPGQFDFSHIDRVLAAMNRQGIKVIIGTPTYAIPTWLAREHPDVLVVTPGGQASYGRRQNMDITNPEYRAAAERVIVALVDHVKDDPAVIGYQLDNETKAYETSGPNVQAAFVASMRRKWPSLDAMNQAYGLDYWSNRINRWEDFPSVNGSINASLSNAFAAFQRSLVTDFLAWQATIVRAHARPDQFLTQNFDLSWRGYSYGIQPDVDQWTAARPLDVAGVDIYHPTQDKLTGAEIAFGGDLARSLRDGQNYLVLETQAQGFPQWTPYPGQLRLQAFSHIASGAQMVEYWHWATTTNAAETYWRGLLSQDDKPNATYEEAKTIGADLTRIGPKIAGMKKRNQVALYVSNTALSAFDSFKLDGGIGYNDVVRSFYDALYRDNIECDIVSTDSSTNLGDYKLIIVPALYAASDLEIERLNDYARRGGHLVYSFKSGFSDENNKVRSTTQPGLIAQAAGVSYQQFTVPQGVSVERNSPGPGLTSNEARWWMEMLTATTADTILHYKSASWPTYAAMTRNRWGAGEVSYIGFMPTDSLLENILSSEADRDGVVRPTGERFPLIVRTGNLKDGHPVRFVFNYSAQARSIKFGEGTLDLLTQVQTSANQPITLQPWGLAILEDPAVPQSHKAFR